MSFYCPLDQEALHPNAQSLQCPKGHSFDLAREGYCNLLLVQQKNSSDPGDNKEMVEARRRFLAAGHYEPISRKLTEYTKALAEKNPALQILDAGCGEGYYLHELQTALPPMAQLSGIDISKWAIKAAAKSYKNIAWAVASNRQLPFAPNSVDLILCLFGFPIWPGFQAVQGKGAHVLLVDPGPEHLSELRKIIYPEVNRTALHKIQENIAYKLIQKEQIDFTFTAKNKTEIQDLLAMTPHGYRIKPEGRERLNALDSLETRASVVFRLLELQ